MNIKHFKTIYLESMRSHVKGFSADTKEHIKYKYHNNIKNDHNKIHIIIKSY